MRKKYRVPAIAAMCLGVTLALLATPVTVAGADDGSVAEEEVSKPLTAAEIDQRLSRISDGSVRGEVADRIDELLEQGAKVYSVATAAYETQSRSVKDAEGGVQPMALPNGCSITSLLSQGGNMVYHDAVTSCGSAPTWSSLTHNMKIDAFHGVLGYRKNVYSVPFSYGPGLTRWTYTSWSCANGNKTRYEGIAGSSTLRWG